MKQFASLRRKTKIVTKYQEKLCELCEKVKFIQKGRAKYCGSYKRKEGCSQIIRIQKQKINLRNWRIKNPERVKYLYRKRDLKRKENGYYKSKKYKEIMRLRYLRRKNGRLSLAFIK